MCNKRNMIFCMVLTGLFLAPAGMAGEQAEEKNRIWAKVGEEVIDDLDVDFQITLLPNTVQSRYSKEALIPKVVQDLVEQKVLAYGGRQAQLEERPEVQFRIKDSIEKILADAYIEYLKESVTVTDQEIMTYYDANPDHFRLPEQVKLRHIVVKDSNEAAQILAEIKEGADFAKIAGEKSLHQTPRKDGDLGWIRRGMLMPELEEKAFGMKKGELSQVVQLQDEYHILRVEDCEDARILPLVDVEDQIERLLIQEKRKEVVKDTQKALEERLCVEFYQEEPAVGAAGGDEGKVEGQ